MALLQIFSFSVFQATGREALILTSEGRNECQKDQLLKDFYTVVKDIISIFKWSDQKIIEESDRKNKLISTYYQSGPFFWLRPCFFLQKDTDPILSRKMLPDDKTNPSLVVIMSIDPVELRRVPPKKRLEWQSARLPQNHTFLD